MSDPSISVVIPIYNMAPYLLRAVCSVIWQLGPKDEIIVVDDGSTDLADSGGIRCFLDRVQWIANPVNRGVSYSRNQGILRAKSEWIYFLDADDVAAPFALTALKTADPEIRPDIKVLTGGCHRMKNGRYHDFLTGAEESLKRILRGNPILLSASFVRRQALLEVGLFDERIDFEQDWDLWLRLSQRYGNCFQVTPQPICFYWFVQAERDRKKRQATVDGLPVREYFRQRYGADPD